MKYKFEICNLASDWLSVSLIPTSKQLSSLIQVKPSSSRWGMRDMVDVGKLCFVMQAIHTKYLRGSWVLHLPGSFEANSGHICNRLNKPAAVFFLRIHQTCHLMGFVIYVHHTDPPVRWYQDGAVWATAQPHLTATIHVQFPQWIGTILHNIMEHPAYHLDMTIPLY